ncbi:MAG: hypothetical protein KGJ50_12145 [Xanthomonadaceae bacterium]|nr:hypothetical protein [Xanthomonadaceae bacterium]
MTNNRVFAWLALATGISLLVPLALQLTIGTGVDKQGFNWRLSDFAVMGALIFVTGSVFVLAARKLARKYWWTLGIAVALGFLYVWAELAVGIFFNIGS